MVTLYIKLNSFFSSSYSPGGIQGMMPPPRPMPPSAQQLLFMQQQIRAQQQLAAFQVSLQKTKLNTLVFQGSLLGPSTITWDLNALDRDFN